MADVQSLRKALPLLNSTEFCPATPPAFNAKIIFSKLDVAHQWTAISASHTTNSIGLKPVKSSWAFPEY